MHNNHFEILSSVVKYFATQMKVFPINSLSITLALRPTLTNNHINKPLTSILLKKFVDEIAMFLHTQDSFADYSFIYYSINKLSLKPEWFLSSARLNKCNKGLPKEVVLFSYKIALMEEHKNIFYRTIENDFFSRKISGSFPQLQKEKSKLCNY